MSGRNSLLFGAALLAAAAAVAADHLSTLPDAPTADASSGDDYNPCGAGNPCGADNPCGAGYPCGAG